MKRKSVPTFRNFIEEHYMKWAKAHKKSWKDDERMLALDWLPGCGQMQMNAVTRRSIQENIMKIKKRSSGATSNRHLSLLSKIFSLATELEVYEGENPCTRIKKFQESTGRERFLAKDEIKRLLGTLDDFKGNVSALLIKFLLFTGLTNGTNRKITTILVVQMSDDVFIAGKITALQFVYSPIKNTPPFAWTMDIQRSGKGKE